MCSSRSLLLGVIFTVVIKMGTEEEILVYAKLNIQIAIKHIKSGKLKYARENLETALEQIKQVLQALNLSLKRGGAGG